MVASTSGHLKRALENQAAWTRLFPNRGWCLPGHVFESGMRDNSNARVVQVATRSRNQPSHRLFHFTLAAVPTN
eukprot:7949670-Alexandrium_andersonii.AAC.1